MKRIIAVCTVCLLLLTSLIPSSKAMENKKNDSLSLALSSTTKYPSWAYSMKVWPFDILYPFNDRYCKFNGKHPTTDAEMQTSLINAKKKGANTVIFYIDDEQSYDTIVSEEGFVKTVSRVQALVNYAHALDLKLICYLNGLEIITVGATADNDVLSFAKDPDKKGWLQQDVTGEKMVWYTDDEAEDWIPANSEDAWASPYSPWRDLFKSRVVKLAQTGLDGIYIDATSLPGVDSFGEKYASIDLYFVEAFKNKYGIDIPKKVDWNSENWRKFIYFRHETIRDYLGEMKEAFCESAKTSAPAVFFEMSACDTVSGTFLGNDNQFTISGGIACSPEVEPIYLDGGFSEGFRCSKATRDANLENPMLFLGWPESKESYRKEFAITLCHSGNYYPTVNDNYKDYLKNSFKFIDSIKASVIDKRVPYQNSLLIYPMRSKDNTIDSGSTLESYNNAFLALEKAHIPFKIQTLETMKASDFKGISNVILAGAESISDLEYALLNTKKVTLIGKNGTKDEWGNTRSKALKFTNEIKLALLKPNLPFTISAPSTSFIEYYKSKDDPNHYFIFVYNDKIGGNIKISKATSMNAKVYTLDQKAIEFKGKDIEIPLNDYLKVIDICK